MTLLAAIVDTSKRVSETRSRLAKVRALAAALRALEPDEITIGAAYLAGEVLQGKVGIGYAVLREARTEATSTPTLTLAKVDAVLTEMTSIRGSGAAMRRTKALYDLFARATAEEQLFLTRLMVGELRQGALGGVMLDAIAAAAQLPPEIVRRAAMYEPVLAAVARTAIIEGAAGLAKFQLEPLSPIAPMLAQTANDVAEALANSATRRRSNGKWTERACRRTKWTTTYASTHAVSTT